MDDDGRRFPLQGFFALGTLVLAFVVPVLFPGAPASLGGAIMFSGLLCLIPIAIRTRVWMDSIPINTRPALVQMTVLGGVCMVSLWAIIPPLIEELFGK